MRDHPHVINIKIYTRGLKRVVLVVRSIQNIHGWLLQPTIPPKINRIPINNLPRCVGYNNVHVSFDTWPNRRINIVDIGTFVPEKPSSEEMAHSLLELKTSQLCFKSTAASMACMGLKPRPPFAIEEQTFVHQIITFFRILMSLAVINIFSIS